MESAAHAVLTAVPDPKLIADSPYRQAAPPVRPIANEVRPVRVSDEAWTGRELCDDGECTGVIGSEGKCSACGKAASA
ncbi:MAG TPA: hypothetical protein VGM90_14025 [Kofleriaceae bacterium]